MQPTLLGAVERRPFASGATRRRPVRHGDDPRAAASLVALVVALAAGCASEPAPGGGRAAAVERATPGASMGAPPAAPETAAQGAPEADEADDRRLGDELAAREAGAEPASRGPADTIAPLGPPGAPARAFPAPSRPVADIVSPTRSTEKARDAAGEAERVMSLLGIREGMSVADIGAGSGYYTSRLSPRVGPSGRVVAQDVVPRYLAELRARVEREGLTNVTVALGEPHDPRLPPRSVDVALLGHMYHEVEQPYGLLYNLYPALREGAVVGVVDMDRPTARHGTPPRLLRCELGALGYRHVATHDLGKVGGYLSLFEPPATRAELTSPEQIEACAA